MRLTYWEMLEIAQQNWLERQVTNWRRMALTMLAINLMLLIGILIGGGI